VLPGFVSAHNHVGYAVFRGRAEDVGHAPTHRLYLPMSQVISAEERQVIGALAVIELLRAPVKIN
jgi:cytosine/adenosine deaminase-related metal-dependent hydrolase